MKKNPGIKDAEIEDLRRRLEEAEETLRAIHEGEVDALVLSKPQGEVVFTLKGAESPYRVFVEAMNEGAATLDHEGTVLYCNNRFAEMVQLSSDKVIGSSIHRFISPADRSGFESAFQRGIQQNTRVDISFKKEDQELLPVHLSFTVLPGQAIPAVCLIAMDLTEHKRLEEMLRQLNADLEKRVEDRTEKLRELNKELLAEIVVHKKAEEALGQSNLTMAGINRILEAALTSETEEKFGRACLDITEKITQSQFSFIGEINRDGLEEIAISNPGWEACKLLDSSGHAGPTGNFKIHGIYGRVLSDGKSLFTNDPAHHPNSIGLPNGHPPLQSFLGVPLICEEGRTIGILAVGNREGGYTPVEQNALEAMAPAVVEALLRIRAEKELRQHSFALQELSESLEQKVHERTAELEEANKRLKELSLRLLSAHEEERKRIAGELHDTIGSCLNAVKYKIDILQPSGNESNITEESLRSIIPVIQEGIEECRRMQQDLRPSILDDLGLLTALSWFCRRYQTIYTGINIELKPTIEEKDIPDPLKIIIFRVMQEAMNNIAKHSKANLVHLFLQKLEGRIELVIEDNGQGFNLKKVLGVESTKRGFGLTSMRERTELSGGSFVIESAEGKGTTVRASWACNL